jgi:hypothetical protein
MPLWRLNSFTTVGTAVPERRRSLLTLSVNAASDPILVQCFLALLSLLLPRFFAGKRRGSALISVCFPGCFPMLQAIQRMGGDL